MKQITRVYDAYAVGAGSVHEVVQLTGIPRKQVSVRTWELEQLGMIKAVGKAPRVGTRGPCGNMYVCS